MDTVTPTTKRDMEQIHVTLVSENPVTNSAFQQNVGGTPSGIRTRDLHLERVTSLAARLWGRGNEGYYNSNSLV